MQAPSFRGAPGPGANGVFGGTGQTYERAGWPQLFPLFGSVRKSTSGVLTRDSARAAPHPMFKPCDHAPETCGSISTDGRLFKLSNEIIGWLDA